MRDDGHELRARPFELAQALRGLTLERVQGRLVDRQRRLVRERADERDLLVRQLDACGHAQRDRAEEPIAGEERERHVIALDDRPRLRHRASRGRRQ